MEQVKKKRAFTRYGILNPEPWKEFLLEHTHRKETRAAGIYHTYLNGRNIAHLSQDYGGNIRHSLRANKTVSLEQADKILTECDLHLSMYFDFCEEKGYKPYLRPPKNELGDY